ncbi:MAG: hypothetical protein NZ733_03750 [Aigarchaeota archaeon]|nr:hypothetical protein [Aigarchaeota archaeon]MCS7127350.1 hypothetical protein [Candidatus Calditenuaceae archaeon]MCX8203639.1 hypothetical protein [Nitrososphaeria archaeon]MDW8042860.1 hypothetical protein [Nitrososphaerota archaeon]
MYGSIREVRVKVGLQEDDSSLDQLLAVFLEEAEALIDATLESHGHQVPLADPPLRIRKLSSTVAALLFLAWRSTRKEEAASLLRAVREELAALGEDIRARGTVLLTGE